ncbi:MAG: CTP synthase [Candidatus Pacebacteria bacterium]|nr:CTP synthase [Candidatus Paceibacterota bacterium]
MKKLKNQKFIFVVGGVMSGVGKGVTASSIGKMLQFTGYKVSAVKIDPYVNVDAGTMNPTEHGETFVLEDGYETDQDMGNYERFLNTSLCRESYMTTGSIYQKVIHKERSLGYKGKTVSVVPHVPLAVIEQIKKAAKKEEADITIVEIGGTVGEYENILFLEAARMMKRKNSEDVAFVLVSYLPVPNTLGEMKTKPTQQAVRTLQESGVFPDIIVGRSPGSMDDRRKSKIATSSMLEDSDIISAPNLDSIYDLPEYFLKEELDIKLLKKLKLRKKTNKKGDFDKKAWNTFVKNTKESSNEVSIAVVGKYFGTGDFVLSDAYVSVIEALKFSAAQLKIKIKIDWLQAQDFEGSDKNKNLKQLKKYDGVLVPGGFGNSGIEGKINVIEYVRKNKIPFFGICLGMQMASVEFARNVLKLNDAHSTEVYPKTFYPIVDILPEQKEKMKKGDYGGSMRLGSYKAHLKRGTLARKIYKTDVISERHRHRYELTINEHKERFEKKGFIISGTSPDGLLPEIIELNQKIHPFFIAVQFHPELQARPLDPHPIFTAFLKAGLKS